MREVNSIKDINKVLGEEIEKSISSSVPEKDSRRTKILDDSGPETKGCRAGFTITDEIIEEDQLKAKVFKYITYKKRTESEIRQKFADEDQDILDNVIEYFKSQNYINENEYIERSINEFLKLKNLSIKELTYKLLQKGVNKKVLDEYVVQNREILVNYEVESAKNIINKKASKMEIDDIKRYLYQKGYMSDTISIAIEETLE